MEIENEKEELKSFIYEKCFTLQKHLTYEDYVKRNPSFKEKTQNILQKCKMNRPIDPNSYVIENEFTILIFQPFDYELYRYAVSAIYTNENKRKQGSAKRLLSNLDFFGSLYFDTKTEELITLLKSIGAFEEEVFKNKDSTQLILDINKNPSTKLIEETIKKLSEEISQELGIIC
ncbi:hypothetical protein [Sulfurimonas sp.]